jgi:hypothetical protein
MGRADASLTNALHLTRIGNTQSSDGVATATVNTVHLDSLGLGRLHRENLDVITRDYSASMPASAAISGIIGRDFFADGLLIIDYPSHTLAFSETRGITTANSGAQIRAAVPRSGFDRATLTNGAIDTGRAAVHGPLRLGEVNAADIEARVADGYPEVMVGADILQHYLIAVDQRTRLVAVCSPHH